LNAGIYWTSADGDLRLAHPRAGQTHLARPVLRRLDDAPALRDVLGRDHAVVLLGKIAHRLRIDVAGDDEHRVVG
jgi:hypothetical protein